MNDGGLAPGLGWKAARLRRIAGDELIEPGSETAVFGGDTADGSVRDHHGGDQPSVQPLPGRWNGPRLSPGWLATSLRD